MKTKTNISGCKNPGVQKSHKKKRLKSDNSSSICTGQEPQRREGKKEEIGRGKN